MEIPQRGPGTDPMHGGAGLGRNPQTMKKQKYFVHYTRCQNDETVTLPVMLHRGGSLFNFLVGFVSISRVPLTAAGEGGQSGHLDPLISAAPMLS